MNKKPYSVGKTLSDQSKVFGFLKKRGLEPNRLRSTGSNKYGIPNKPVKHSTKFTSQWI